ncbi:MAG: PD40 domain-containing protein, partial [Myxococcales bacterium]|nr:PD40 domain-containing protein [Myxococcales bacterium]
MTHRTPAFVATMWAVVLLACSCDRRPTRSDDAVDDQTDAPALPAPVVEPVEAVDSAGEEPETARPRSPTPSLVGSDYVPDDDPENGGPEGFPLTRARDPADPTDARKRPFTIEALYQLKGIGAPTWAPDGLHIAFTVTSYDLQRGEQNQDVYVIAADGTGLRRMTQGSAQDGDPQWSPDGKSLLFRADRGDVPQLYRMAVDGGEAERVTDVPTGVDTPRWVPGGDRVLFVSRVFPEFGADMSAQRSALEDRERSPIRAHLADELLFRHWTQYDDGRVQHIFSHAASDGGVVDLTPGAFEAPAFSLDDDGLAISPDGRELAFVSNRDPGSTRAWTTNRDVFVVSIAPGTKYEAINLTDSNEAHDGLPSYSPDGKWIAFLRQEIPGFEADRFRLAVHDRETGEQRILTEGFDYWVTDLRWAPDSRSIVFQADVEGRTPLFTVALETGEIEKLALPSVHGFDVASTGALAFTFSRVGEPIELYTADADGA